MNEHDFAKALGRIPSGIFIITARKGVEESAMLASWVQQASFAPPTLSVAVHKDRPISKVLTEDTAFAVNVLDETDQELYKHFVKGFPPDARPFEGIATRPGHLNTIVLLEALAFLECRVRVRIDTGDHHLVVADVLDGAVLKEGQPRVHIRKTGLSY